MGVQVRRTRAYTVLHIKEPALLISRSIFKLVVILHNVLT